ncbi:MAG: DUF5715 family protein [Acidobacteria bacterium]|nr:DUF5715 family protein [Acidobacteriota bacterium]
MRQAAFLFLTALVLAAASSAAGCRRAQRREAALSAPAGVPTPMLDPWKQAALKIEEDRGEAIGRKAAVEIPAELKQYKERKRFLSIQVAAWREGGFETPHDFAALVEQIRRGEFVEVPALGDDYLLYGVGLAASDEPMTHYDKATGKSVTLYGRDADFEADYAQLKDSLAAQDESTKELSKELAGLPKKERERRKALAEEIAEKRRDAAATKSRMQLLDSFYRKPARRKILAEEYEELASFARDFGGRAYDLQDAAARKEFKARLLAYARPAAFEMIKELARAYRQKFDRHLPFTSLVRTDEYQRQLNAVNPNATLIETAPHTTGLAFDIYYHFLTAAEQDFVMSELARLEREGRVEALRELRDHYHVFAARRKPPRRRRSVRRADDAERSGTATALQAVGRVSGSRARSRRSPSCRPCPRRAGRSSRR